MWNNHHSVFGHHLRYVKNEMIKPNKEKILEYYECMYEILDIFQNIYSTNKKNEEHHQAGQKYQYVKFSEYMIRKAINYGIPE